SLAVVPREDYEECAADFVAVARLLKLSQVRTRARRDVVFLVEEVGEWEEFERSAVRRVATGYRKYGVAVVLSAQRAVGIPKSARVQASHLVTFRQDDDEDLHQLQSKFGERVTEIRSLEIGKFLLWREGAVSSN